MRIRGVLFFGIAVIRAVETTAQCRDWCNERSRLCAVIGAVEIIP